MQDEQTTETEQTSKDHRHFGLEEAVFILLIVLSLVGIAVTDFSQHDGYTYWAIMVLAFGGLAIFVSWLQAKTSENDFGKIVKEQGKHWLHTLVVVAAATLVIKNGQFSELNANLMILLILAMATMLDGMRIGWQFSLVGFFLAACAIIVAYVERFILACVGLGFFVVVGTLFWGYWINRHAEREEPGIDTRA